MRDERDPSWGAAINIVAGENIVEKSTPHRCLGAALKPKTRSKPPLKNSVFSDKERLLF
jgi:hypothetical protein